MEKPRGLEDSLFEVAEFDSGYRISFKGEVVARLTKRELVELINIGSETFHSRNFAIERDEGGNVWLPQFDSQPSWWSTQHLYWKIQEILAR